MFVENRADGFDARVRKHIYGFREGLQISKKNPLIETVIKQYLMIVEVEGEILTFAINRDFQCINAVIKILLFVFLIFMFSFSVMLVVYYIPIR